MTKRCSAHLTSQGWGRLDFAPRGHLPSSWHVPMGPRHHLASGDQGRVPRREERMEEEVWWRETVLLSERREDGLCLEARGKEGR